MRTFIFRGKTLEGSKWVFGDLEYRRAEKRSFIHTYTDTGEYDKQYEVTNESVGQYTGLCDKCGFEIYEGHKVLWDKNGKEYVVISRSGMFYASIQELNKDISGGFPLWFLCAEGGCTITGDYTLNKNN